MPFCYKCSHYFVKSPLDPTNPQCNDCTLRNRQVALYRPAAGPVYKYNVAPTRRYDPIGGYDYTATRAAGGRGVVSSRDAAAITRVVFSQPARKNLKAREIEFAHGSFTIREEYHDVRYRR